MSRVVSWFGACASVWAALSVLACSSASDSPAGSSGAQAAAPVAGSSVAPAGSGPGPAANSGGSAAAGDATLPPTSAAGSPAQASPAGAGSDGAAGVGTIAGTNASMATAGAGGVAGEPPAANGGAGGADPSAPFELMPVGFPMAGDELTFPETANPPANQSPEFSWTGVPAEARSLALAFRDLGNSAVKWIIWDIPPTLMHIPPNLSPVAMPPEIPGSSQLGSLDNQGYAGPGSGARQYDFTLWALDTEELPVTPRMTTVEIHALMDTHDLAKTPPILVRNTRNL